MPTPAFTHFVFVDFENVPKVDLSLIEGTAIHVTLMIGKSQNKFPYDLMETAHRLSTQVTFVKLEEAGRNALDFTLSCYFGRAIERFAGAQFSIVSKDGGFDPMIAHLKGTGVRVARHKDFASLFVLPKQKSPSPSKSVDRTKQKLGAVPLGAPKANRPGKSADKFLKFTEHLRNSPPANRVKLEHTIEAYFKPSLPAGGLSGVIRDLEQRQILTIHSDGKITVHKS